MAALTSEFIRSLCGAYGDFLRRQRATGTSALWTWPLPNARRAPEFAWLGTGDGQAERLLSNSEDIHVGPAHPALTVVAKISATIALNPYEREALYGFPFVIGKQGKTIVRAPLFVIPVSIEPSGRGFSIRATEDRVAFNAFPFFGDATPDALELALSRLGGAVPQLPLTSTGVRRFLDDLQREVPELEIDTALDGRLSMVPERPKGTRDFLNLVAQAAVLVAPQSNYFLVSDLETLAHDAASTGLSCLGAILGGAGAEQQVDITAEMEARAKVLFPFPSNRAQRRAAILLDDPTTRVIRIDGPPGTGKSLTIANLTCHLAASGKTVLVTSQKDKALDVVSEKLRTLNDPILPMTLLNRDKRPLLERLSLVRKERSKLEVEQELLRASQRLEQSQSQYLELAGRLERAVASEPERARADAMVDNATGVRRLMARVRRHRTWSRLNREVPSPSSAVSELATRTRVEINEAAVDVLALTTEATTAKETRAERQNREELAKIIKRNQGSYKNFSLFDRLKAEPERADMLLRSLPAWIMSPDDVARLFPCKEGVFDVVIVDEASQVDLPSILPILYRGKKVVICGDARQMQPKRFAFTADAVARTAWQAHRAQEHDPDEFFYPTRQSLLELAQTRADESVFLDEHFRSMPSIITFSNDRWYGSRMRIMTDESLKKFGGPSTPAMSLHLTSGTVIPDSQVNELEARELVDLLKSMLASPEYSGATFGVLCLFVEQMEYIQSLVEEEIDEDVWRPRSLVILNPDGMQGDERDVILYSLSFDAKGMTRQQLIPRLHEQAHIQGMLNVAFTRARHEVHVFHSAAPSEFGFSSSRSSALSDWLAHCVAVMDAGRIRRAADRGGKVDSQFEADVADGLRRRGFSITHQYPACGFWIDLVVEHETCPGVRLAVECDGEVWHQDEHGQRTSSDIEREEILQRAGWHMARIPYSSWRRAPDAELSRVASFFFPGTAPGQGGMSAGGAGSARTTLSSPTQNLIIAGLREGLHDQRDIAKFVATRQGFARLGARIERGIVSAGFALVRSGHLVIENEEWFLTATGRAIVLPAAADVPRIERDLARRAAQTEAEVVGHCSCGGSYVVRDGKYGRFLGCTNYPRCQNTKGYRQTTF